MKATSKKQFQNFFRNQDGFTLMEMIVSLTIMGFITIVVVGMIGLSAKINQEVYWGSVARSELNVAMERLRIDIQQLSPDSVLHSVADRLTFYDMDKNYVNYHMVANDLFRNDKLILKNMDGAPFKYYDAALTEVTLPGQVIAVIEVTLKINRGGRTYQQQERYYARN